MSSSILFANQFGQVDKTTFGEAIRGLLIKHKYCHASISLYGGQVLSWQPEGHREVLWLSDSSEFTSGKAIRGGIPLCWPWFGPYKDGGNHGFARQQVWQLDSIDVDKDAVTVILSWFGEKIHPLWPAPCELRQELVFGKEFKQTLYMKNSGHEELSYSGALHSYFSVSAPENVDIEVLNAASFDDKLTGESGKTASLAHCRGPLDRVYHYDKAVELKDNQWQRTITISPEHTRQWVVWNPGTAIAEKMSDIHTGGEHEFVCVEAANSQWQQLPPGRWLTMAQTIKVTKH